MRLKSVTILTLMLLPMVSQTQRQQYQQVNDISYTASDFASPNGTLLSLLDRLFYSNLHTDWSMKVGAAVSIARRGGATATMDGYSSSCSYRFGFIFRFTPSTSSLSTMVQLLPG